LVETLGAEQVDFDAFDARLISISDRLSATQFQSAVQLNREHAAHLMADTNAHAWHLPLGLPSALTSIAEQLLCAHLQNTHSKLVCLWTEGSAMVEPSYLLMSGLPHPSNYTALLDGSWSTNDWSSVAAAVAAAPSFDMTLVNEPQLLSYQSAELSDVGLARSVNQDACLARPEIGLWVVADGMGGHRDGDVASRMVCDALADLTPAASLELTVTAVQERLQAVNAHLQHAATRSVNPVQSGSTVVVLLVRGDHCAILWAGDSRVYRWRNDELTQLTQDHNWAAIGGDDDPQANAITRAVGGEATLVLDVYRDQVRAGDRYLLCSDGLTREVPDVRLATLLAQSSIEHCAHELVSAALNAGGSDNVSVIVVEARQDAVSGE
jgi:serine/threonine protein phosphatase PrpC